MGQPSAADANTPRKRSWFARHKILTALGVIVLLTVIASLNGGGDDDPAPSAGQGSTPSGGATPTNGDQDAGPAQAAIGTPVRDGKFEFTVHGIECGETEIGSEFLSTTAQGHFCLLSLTVANIGDREQSFSGDNQYLFNDAGQKYSADTTAAIYLEDSKSLYEKINPGNSITGRVVFDLPAGMTPSRVELHDSAFSDGVTVPLG